MTGFIKFHKNLITELTLIAAAALSVAVGGINIYVLVFSVLMHELGHICAALIKGARAENFAIHGFGIELTFPGKSPCPRSLLVISAGGPVLSLVIALVSYLLKQPLLCAVNLSIAIINILPVYPLDGGNILSCIFSEFFSRKKIRKFMKFTGRFVGIIITFCGICILYISTFNISLLYMGLFIFFSADRPVNPVTEVTSAAYSKVEKSSLFIIDSSLSILDAAGNLPVNSVGAVKDENGKIISFVTPLYLYEVASKNDNSIEKLIKNV